MKKTHKALMGITALVVAFSTFAFTGCSDVNKDGSIKGNYQEATAEQVNEALKEVNQETLFGDTTAKDYKLGIDESANFNFSFTMGTDTSVTASLSESYQTLVTGDGTNFNYIAAGNVTMSAETKMPLGNTYAAASATTTTQSVAVSVDLYQDNLKLYAAAATGETKEDLENPKASIKAMINLETIMAMLPTGDVTLPSLPGSITTPDLSAMDLVTALNMLNEMGVTTSMDTKSGIKLKVSFTEDSVSSILASATGAEAEVVKQYLSFTTFKLDFYLSIDKDGKFSMASIVADIDATYDASAAGASASTSASAMNIKLSGNATIKVDSGVNPTAPKNFNSAQYYDYTSIIIESIGSGGILG